MMYSSISSIFIITLDISGTTLKNLNLKQLAHFTVHIADVAANTAFIDIYNHKGYVRHTRHRFVQANLGARLAHHKINAIYLNMNVHLQ